MATLLATAVAYLPPAVGEAMARKKGLCATAARRRAAPPYVAIVSAFPAELAPLVAATTVEKTVEVEGRQYYLGRLDGVSVVLGLTGIGVLNASARAESILANFEVAGIVMSAVAGSPYSHTDVRIGDVVVADDWVLRAGGPVFHPNPALVALARRAGSALPGPLEQCTPVPPTAANAHTVCMPYQPTVIFGGRDVSDDKNGSTPFPCTPRGDEIFGCELPSPTPAAAPDLEDEETAAVAAAAAERGVPFLGVRAISDGFGDPLGDRGFVFQFLDYYRLAARNAGAVTRAFFGELKMLTRGRSARARSACRLLAKGRWDRAAARIQPR